MCWADARLQWTQQNLTEELLCASNGRHTAQWVTFGPYRADVSARNPARHVAEKEDL